MPKLTIGQKAARVVQFMIGLRNPRVAQSLSAHGFTADDLQDGLDRLGRLAKGRLDLTPVHEDSQLVVALDAWENKWFPIASASLVANHPEAHELLFRNLTQTTGPEVIVTVGTFVDRVEQLTAAKAAGGLGRDGKAARDLLIKRGLTDETLREARALLRKVGTIEEASDQDSAFVEDEHAERELWNWYLEWASIARVVITDRRLLRGLGFLKYKPRTGESETEPEEPEETEEPIDPDVDSEDPGEPTPED